MTSPVSERQIRVVQGILEDGRPHRFTELEAAAGTAHLNTVACELRARGFDVRMWRVPLGRDGRGRPTATWYFRLVVDALEGADVPCLAALASAPSSAAVGKSAVTSSANHTPGDAGCLLLTSGRRDSRAVALDSQLELIA